jgi:hypothetical protein
VTRRKDGRDWVIGTEDDVRWIQKAISISSTVTSAVPPHFSAYATVLVPDKHGGRSEDLRVLLDVLGGHSGDQPWWLGYLETGTDDLVFPDAPRTRLYSDWRYVLVLASWEKAAQWRRDFASWRAPGPDLIFPADRSWLVSWLWDDDWRSLGGPSDLVGQLLDAPLLQARRIGLDDEVAPPGYDAI